MKYRKGLLTVEAALVMAIILMIIGTLLLELCTLHDKAVLYETAQYYAREYREGNPLLNGLALMRFKADANRRMLRMEVRTAEYRETSGECTLVCEAAEKNAAANAFREALGIRAVAAEVEVPEPVDAVFLLRFARGIVFRQDPPERDG